MTVRKPKKKILSIQVMLVMMILLAVVATYFLVVFPILNPDLGMSFYLPVVLVFGVVDLVVVLTLASGILDHFELSCKDEALGLPSGSIRALIALSLIVIFAIMAVFMGSQLATTPLSYNNGTYVTDVNGTIQFTQPSQAQRDFSSQTLTTVSTLVVAVAGFYFGSKAVETARGQKTESYTISTKPEDFGDVKGDGNLEIEVTTDPANQGLNWEVTGDVHSSLVPETSNKFKYSPSKKPTRTTDKVVLTFKVVNDDSVQAKLRVRVEETEEAPKTPATEAKVAEDKKGKK